MIKETTKARPFQRVDVSIHRLLTEDWNRRSHEEASGRAKDRADENRQEENEESSRYQLQANHKISDQRVNNRRDQTHW